MTEASELVSYKKILSNPTIIRKCETDPDTGLDLFCYSECNNDSEEWIKKCRGIVFHNDKVIMSSLPFTEEYVPDTFNRQTDISSMLFFPSYEGTLIRTFYFNDKWYVSTYRKLCAYKSKWVSPISFGDQFDEAIRQKYEYVENSRDIFFNTLDIHKQYMFILRHDGQNRVVHSSPDNGPIVYHLCTIDNDKLVFDDNDNVFPNVPQLSFNSTDGICKYVYDNIDPHKSQGLLGISKDGTKQIKIVHPEYKRLYDIRGNEFNLMFRYIQLRNTTLEKDFKFLYPLYTNIFDEIEKQIHNLADFLLFVYKKRHIHKQFVQVHKDEHTIIKLCHRWYIKNQFQYKVDIEVVLDILNSQQPSIMNRLIRNHRSLSQ